MPRKRFHRENDSLWRFLIQGYSRIPKKKQNNFPIDFSIPIYRILKKIYKKGKITQNSMEILNHILNFTLLRLIDGAHDLFFQFYNYRRIGFREIKEVARYILPGQIFPYAMVEAKRASQYLGCAKYCR